MHEQEQTGVKGGGELKAVLVRVWMGARGIWSPREEHWPGTKKRHKSTAVVEGAQ